MKLKKEIEKYVPFNEQEEKDKEAFLSYISTFEDVLTRKNIFGHFSSSALVLNKNRTKILAVHHNIYGCFIYPGGHADGIEDLVSVAVREVEEETGVKISKQILDSVFAIQAIAIKGHYKKGKYVSAHTHLDVLYLFEADDTIPLVKKEDENSKVIWIPIDEFVDNTTDFMKPFFIKIVEKLKTI